MYYTGKDMVKDLKYGNAEVKAVYHQTQRIYPNIVDQQTGYDYTDWNYDNLPERTRTATPWTRDVYSDGSLGEKVKGTPVSQKETATRSFVYGTWDYTINTATGSRTRTVIERFQFSDIAKDVQRNPETENGARSQGGWTYDWVNSKRNATVTYKFSDKTETITLSESGTVTYNFTITPANTTVIPAGGGSKSINATGNIDKKWNNVITTSTTATVTSIKFSGTIPTGFTISGRNVNAANRGTTEGAILTANVCGVATVDNKSLTSTAISVSQEANYLSLKGHYYLGKYISNDYSANNYIKVGNNGGSINLSLNNVTVHLAYSSGSIIAINTNTYPPTLNASRASSRIVDRVEVFGTTVHIAYKAYQASYSVTESFNTSISITYKSNTYSMSSSFVIEVPAR